MKSKPTKALIIDDEELVRDALHIVLERSGFDTVSTESAIEALSMENLQEFDIILTDIVMPKMDGVAFIKEMREREILTPIITLTGGARVGQKNMSAQALEAGACKALRKPVEKKQLLEAIEIALNL